MLPAWTVSRGQGCRFDGSLENARQPIQNVSEAVCGVHVRRRRYHE
jgi:hypothetical protein